MTEDEMVGWHHQLNGHEFEQAIGYGKGQGSLACCSQWGLKESDMTEQLNNNFLVISIAFCIFQQLNMSKSICFFLAIFLKNGSSFCYMK